MTVLNNLQRILVGVLLCLGMRSAVAFEKTVLSDKWDVQPAASAEITPFKTDWSRMGSVDWRNMAKNKTLRYLMRGPQDWYNLKTEQVGFGITSDVYLLTLPASVGILDSFVQTSVRKKEIALTLDLQASTELRGISAKAEVIDADGNAALSFTVPLAPIAAGQSTQTVKYPWRNPRLWEVENPYLYHVRVSLVKNDAVVDRGYETTFGFREI